MTAESHDELHGKVAIVTGASRGIGRALAVGLSKAGAAVVCAARSEVEVPNELPGTIHSTAEAIRAAGGTALPLRCDIGIAEDIENLVKMSLREFGRVDVLVNNAMTPTRGLFLESSSDQWDESMRVNVRSLFLTCQAVIPTMARQGAGSIINISSGAAESHGLGMPPGFLTYSVAKAAMERFSTALAAEVADRGVAVNALRPGAVKTEKSVQELGEDWDWSGWTSTEAVVPAVLFLAAQNGRGFTGRIVESIEFGDAWP
jgi:NAD(P)-dependent dehydrogenase (short-subunit alcohol dehydrogenase family)